jgi:hypothetical protein
VPTKLEKAVKELVDSQERQSQERRRKDQGLIDLLLDTAAVERQAHSSLSHMSEEERDAEEVMLENIAMVQKHHPTLSDEDARIAIREAGF